VERRLLIRSSKCCVSVVVLTGVKSRAVTADVILRKAVRTVDRCRLIIVPLLAWMYVV